MTVNQHDLQKIIDKAWLAAKNQFTSGQSSGDRNNTRSATWVIELAKRFQDKYPTVDHRVFWRQNEENKRCFLLQEFLFDVTVAQIKYVQTLQNLEKPRKVPVIVRCKWIVESEFNTGNLKEILKDASKLVVADAENKLLVISHRDKSTEAKLQNRLSCLANECSGDLFLAFVAHPGKWNDSSAPKPLLMKWGEGRFTRVT